MFMQVVKRYKYICIEQNSHMPLPTAGGGGGGPERMGPRPPPWVPLLKNPIMVAVSFPPV